MFVDLPLPVAMVAQSLVDAGVAFHSVGDRVYWTVPSTDEQRRMLTDVGFLSTKINHGGQSLCVHLWSPEVLLVHVDGTSTYHPISDLTLPWYELVSASWTRDAWVKFEDNPCRRMNP